MEEKPEDDSRSIMSPTIKGQATPNKCTALPSAQHLQLQLHVYLEQYPICSARLRCHTLLCACILPTKNLHVAVRACKFPLERLARLIDYRAVRALADMCSGETRRRPVLWRALVHGGAQYLVPARDWETTNDLISGRDSGNVHARTCPRGAAAQRAAPVRARALLSGTRSPHAG